MRFRTVLTLLMLCVGCSAGEPALTHEQAAALQQTLGNVRSRLLPGIPDDNARRRLDAELTALDRALSRGTSDELTAAIVAVRSSTAGASDSALSFVLEQAESAVRTSPNRRHP
jgi:hypothetical protein